MSSGCYGAIGWEVCNVTPRCAGMGEGRSVWCVYVGLVVLYYEHLPCVQHVMSSIPSVMPDGLVQPPVAVVLTSASTQSCLSPIVQLQVRTALPTSSVCAKVC